MLWLLILAYVIVVLLLGAWINSAHASGGKSPFDYSTLTYAWVLGVSALGGLVSFTKKLRDGTTTRFRYTEFIGELVTSAFAGLLTFWLCEAASFDKLFSAVLIAISGHMGSRALFRIERYMESRFGPDEPRK